MRSVFGSMRLLCDGVCDDFRGAAIEMVGCDAVTRGYLKHPFHLTQKRNLT
jgi:hypothetical protein